MLGEGPRTTGLVTATCPTLGLGGFRGPGAGVLEAFLVWCLASLASSDHPPNSEVDILVGNSEMMPTSGGCASFFPV